MKITLFTTLAAIAGSCMFSSAQDAAFKRPDRSHGFPPQIIKEFDKDGDGKLNDDEKAAMMAKVAERRKEAIAKYDADGDGKLNEEERKKALEDRKAMMVKQYDKDGDGELSQEERAAMPRPPRGEGANRPGGKGKGPDGEKAADGEKAPEDKAAE